MLGTSNYVKLLLEANPSNIGVVNNRGRHVGHMAAQLLSKGRHGQTSFSEGDRVNRFHVVYLLLEYGGGSAVGGHAGDRVGEHSQTLESPYYIYCAVRPPTIPLDWDLGDYFQIATALQRAHTAFQPEPFPWSYVYTTRLVASDFPHISRTDERTGAMDLGAQRFGHTRGMYGWTAAMYVIEQVQHEWRTRTQCFHGRATTHETLGLQERQQNQQACNRDIQYLQLSRSLLFGRVLGQPPTPRTTLVSLRRCMWMETPSGIPGVNHMDRMTILESFLLRHLRPWHLRGIPSLEPYVGFHPWRSLLSDLFEAGMRFQPETTKVLDMLVNEDQVRALYRDFPQVLKRLVVDLCPCPSWEDFLTERDRKRKSMLGGLQGGRWQREASWTMECCVCHTHDSHCFTVQVGFNGNLNSCCFTCFQSKAAFVANEVNFTGHCYWQPGVEVTQMFMGDRHLSYPEFRARFLPSLRNGHYLG